MAEKVIKIQFENNDGRKENFYIKFYVDMIYPCIAKFRTKLVDRCPELATANFSVFWIDDDNDEIIIKNDDDLRFYSEQTSAGKVVVRVEPVEKVVEKQQATQSQSSQEYFVPTSTPGNEPNKNEIHYGIICDSCDGTITGYRYKCMQCADFDLCMKCEQQMVHRHHLMIRISNENMKNLPARQNCKINLRQFAPRMAAEGADVEMGEPAPADDKQKKGDRHRKGKQEAKEKKLEEKAKRHQERALRCRQKLDRCGRYTIPHFLSYMMDPANLGIAAPIPLSNPVDAEPAQQQQQQQQQQTPPSKSFRAAASANLPANMGGAAASAHIGCPFSFASQPLQHIHQLNRTLSNFLSPLGVNVEFGLPSTVTTTTTTTSSATNGGDNNEKLTQTETRTDDTSSQTQQQPQEEKLTQTDSKQTSTTSTSTSSIKMSSSSSTGAETVVEADIPTFVSQNRELFAKIAASAAAGAAHSAALQSAEAAHSAALQSAEVAHAALHSAEVASSLAAQAVPQQALPEPFVEDCTDGEKSPTESITEAEALNSSFDDKLNTSEEDSVSVLSESTHDNDDWTYVYQQAFDKAEEAAAAHATGAIPKVPSGTQSPSVDFVQLSNDLKKHIEEQLCQDFGAAKVADEPVELASAPVLLPSDKAIPMPAPVSGAVPLRQHERPHIDMAIRSMMAMGFNNEGGWLTRLLETVDGNIPRALEFLQPHK